MSGIRDLLIRGTAAAKAGSIAEARAFLERVLRLDPNPQEKVEALLWLAQIENAPHQKRDYLEELLAINPYHPHARRLLAVLDGRLDEADIVDADMLTRPQDAGPSLCPDCGGPLVFAADGRARQCERCGWHSGPSPHPSSTSPEQLLSMGITAVKANNQRAAQQQLQAVTQHPNATQQQKIQAWLWLSGVTPALPEKRACIEEVLRLDPEHAIARQAMARLAPVAEETPTPPTVTQSQDTIPAAPLAESEGNAPLAQRFICGQCGGKMAFAAGGNRLECTYCGNKQTLMKVMQSGGMVQEHDFSVALATAKGHSRPTGVHPFRCQGCQATYLLAPGVLSLTCPYCGSAHALELPAQQLIMPEAVLPFAVDADAARQAYRAWLLKKHEKDKSIRSTDVHGVYLPVWTFDIGGDLSWVCTIVVRRNRQTTTYQKTGDYAVDYDDILVPASHTLPVELVKEVDEFDLSALQPYNPGYLADWPSEVYEIAVSDASIAARQQAQKQTERKVYIRVDAVKGYNESVRDVQINTGNMLVYAYKLILLPFWIAHYRDEETVYHVVINGQTGHVRGQEKQGVFKKLLSGVFGGN
ncbi:MAG: hypothetical protein JXA33_20850 [Anaerolineae bacterium]|nr:hypothetical protein [Anaerolineae bacterium]